MTKETAIEAANLLYVIERCEDYADALSNINVVYDLEDDAVINQFISETIEKINGYKQTIEKKLEEL